MGPPSDTGLRLNTPLPSLGAQSQPSPKRQRPGPAVRRGAPPMSMERDSAPPRARPRLPQLAPSAAPSAIVAPAAVGRPRRDSGLRSRMSKFDVNDEVYVP